MKRHVQESIDLLQVVLTDEDLLGALERCTKVVTDCLRRGNKLLIAGNGGSAADAQHFSAELVGRYLKERKAYSALALTVDSSVLTAWSNDYAYDTVFARQIEAHGRTGDVFVGISTSGNSVNLVKAAEKAKELGLLTACLLGKGGGRLKSQCDIALVVPSVSTPRIQEVHGLLIHAICEEVENALA